MKKRNRILIVFLSVMFCLAGMLLSACKKADNPYNPIEPPTPTPPVVDHFNKLDEHNMNKIISKATFDVDMNVEENKSVFKPADNVGDNMVLKRNSVNQIYGKYTGVQSEIAVAIGDYITYGTIIDGEFSVYLKPMAIYKPFNLTIITPTEKITLKNVVFGETIFLAGQSNMEWNIDQFYNQTVDYAEHEMNAVLKEKAKALKSEYENIINTADTYDSIRLFRVNPTINLIDRDMFYNECKWVEANSKTIGNFSATGYILGKLFYDKYKIPVGLVMCCTGGTKIAEWTPSDKILELENDGVKVNKFVGNANLGSLRYNGMAKPLRKMRFSAVHFYQGENNDDAPNSYERELEGYIDSMRVNFDDSSLNFFIYGLARLQGGRESEWGVIRTSQSNVADVKENVEFVNIIDTGHPTNIHPIDKPTVARYGFNSHIGSKYKENVIYKSPSASDISIDGDEITITYENVGSGLELKGENGFELVTINNKYYVPEVLILDKDKLMLVIDPSFGEIKAIRYGVNAGSNSLYGLTLTQKNDINNLICLYSGEGNAAECFIYSI